MDVFTGFRFIEITCYRLYHTFLISSFFLKPELCSSHVTYLNDCLFLYFIPYITMLLVTALNCTSSSIMASIRSSSLVADNIVFCFICVFSTTDLVDVDTVPIPFIRIMIIICMAVSFVSVALMPSENSSASYTPSLSSTLEFEWDTVRRREKKLDGVERPRNYIHCNRTSSCHLGVDSIDVHNMHLTPSSFFFPSSQV